MTRLALGPLAGLALGFILPGPILLRQLGQHRAEALPPSLRIPATLILIGDEARGFAEHQGLPLSGQKLDRLELDASLSLAGGSCQLELSHAGRPLGSVRQRGDETETSGATPAAAAAIVADGCAPFLFRGAGAEAQLGRLLHRHGGDPSSVALTRFDGRVAYAIGGASSALTVSQRSLLPLRLSLGDAHEELRYREYRAIFLSGSFPGRIELWHGGQETAELEAHLGP
ncbi:MAG: hypothetical protein ACYCWW_06905 [Deltaproteobacteria bacterium]